VFDKDSGEKFYITYIKAVSRGIILSIVLILIIAAMFYFTSLSEEFLNTAIWIVTIISICYSSIYGAYKIAQKGYLHGGAIGAIYMILLTIIATLAEKGQLNLKAYFVSFLAAIVIGALSGMIGIIIGNKD
jgi:putative membrane protein (TIGR04086 family)